MIGFPLINKVLVLIIDITAIWLGFLVLRNNTKKKTNRVFVLMVVLMLCWVNFAYFARLIENGNNDLSILFLKIAWFVTPLFFSFLYLLVESLIKQKQKTLRSLVLLLGVIAACATSFTDLIIKGIKFINGDLTIIYGTAMLPFLGIIFFLICATLYLIFKGYTKAVAQEKERIKYFLVGISIFYLCNLVFNIALPLIFKITRFYWLGDYSSIFLLAFIAFAIVKKQLFGVKVVLTQLFVGLIALLLLVNLLISQTLFEYVWKGGLFVAFLVFGWLLVRSVMREIKQKDKLDKLATDLATANIRLEGANKKLQKLDKAKSEFISIASHQLRTPLTAIKGYISMLLEGDYGNIPKDAKQPLENVFISDERLIKLVNSLLNISRIEAGRIKYNPGKCSIYNFVKSIAEEFTQRAKERKLFLKFEAKKEKMPTIMADEQKLREVISNLIDNAIKYTHKGGITVKLGQTGKKIKITIGDTGEGLTQQEMAKLFQSFSRAGAGKKFWIEGSGLGLYVAKKFIDMHKGKIWVQSPGKNKGSCFHIELPIK